METDYLKVISEIDAREVLRYLNDLGVHNISAEVLKFFITDLKKLIKYDLQSKYPNRNSTTHEVEGFERLHSASTFSSRLKSKIQESEAASMCSRECQKTRRLFKVRNIASAPILGHKKLEMDSVKKRSCSCVRIEKKSDLAATVPSKGSPPSASSTNLIKVQKQPVAKKCDPVQLYHYYTSMWAKYKANVPGENNWADLRWEIRKKMAGAGDEQRPYKTSETDAHRLTIAQATAVGQGRYTCEVSAEAPSFQTSVAHTFMHVVDLPDEGPELYGMQDGYKAGMKLRAECVLRDTQPAANLTFLLNREPVVSKQVWHRVEVGANKLMTAYSNIQFVVQRHDFKDNRIKVLCLATIYSIYVKGVEVGVEELDPPTTTITSTTTAKPRRRRPRPNNMQRNSNPTTTSTAPKHVRPTTRLIFSIVSLTELMIAIFSFC